MAEIQMIPVESTQIKAIGFNTLTDTLRVEFVKGGMYDYENVPLPVYTEFLKSDSKGKFLGTEIKGKFEYKKLTPA